MWFSHSGHFLLARGARAKRLAGDHRWARSFKNCRHFSRPPRRASHSLQLGQLSPLPFYSGLLIVNLLLLLRYSTSSY